MEDFRLRNGVSVTSRFGQNLQDSMLIGYGEGQRPGETAGQQPGDRLRPRPRTRKDADSDQA